MGRKKDDRALLREKVTAAALAAADRLRALFEDEGASNGDVVKAAALVFDRVDMGEGCAGGDYDITVKEE